MWLHWKIQFLGVHKKPILKGVGVLISQYTLWNLTPCCIKVLPCCIKVLRLNICTSKISLSRTAYQMWCPHHPLTQRNKTIKWAVGVGVGSKRERRGGRQNLKKEVGNIGGGGLYKIGGLGPFCRLCTNWLTDNSSKFSKFSNSIPAWL